MESTWSDGNLLLYLLKKMNYLATPNIAVERRTLVAWSYSFNLATSYNFRNINNQKQWLKINLLNLHMNFISDCFFFYHKCLKIWCCQQHTFWLVRCEPVERQTLKNKSRNITQWNSIADLMDTILTNIMKVHISPKKTQPVQRFTDHFPLSPAAHPSIQTHN